MKKGKAKPILVLLILTLVVSVPLFFKVRELREQLEVLNTELERQTAELLLYSADLEQQAALLSQLNHDKEMLTIRVNTLQNKNDEYKKPKRSCMTELMSCL